ncbi:hypothetical protein PTKIN_Ptkin06aG0176500 [Pterospermum kingtungense]
MVPPMMKKQKRMARLPEHIVLISEIMPKLPPKSILRFRCLSKSWEVSLSSPDFIAMHLDRVQQCKYDDMQHLILRSSDDSLQSIKYEAYKKTASNLDFPSKYSYHSYFPNVLGSCNGLLCVALSRKKLLLCNPSIKEFKKLPLSCPLDDDSLDAFGFGYDCSANDYKVVRFVHPFHQVHFSTSWQAVIYSLKSSTWKTIQGFPSHMRFENSKTPGTLVDGLLYWTMSSRLFCPSSILGFDIAFEKFDVFPLPDDTTKNEGYGLTLGKIGGSLSVAHVIEGGITEMWKLEKKGDNNKHGWIKVMTIMKNMQTLPLPHRLVPICVMKNGEVLVTYDENVDTFKTIFSRFELYDPVKGTFRELIVGGMKRSYQAIPYTESLVSPNLV